METTETVILSRAKDPSGWAPAVMLMDVMPALLG
jgi:hypothetical protein